MIKWLTVSAVLLILNIAITVAAEADVYESYMNENITVITVELQMLPENTKHKCVDNVLYVHGRPARMYTGTAIACKTRTITRREHEVSTFNTLY